MGNELIREADIAPPPLMGGDRRQKLSGREILDTLLRQKGTILTLWSLVLVATLAYSFLTPRMYESEMTILLQEKRMDQGLRSQAVERLETSVTDAQLATEMQLLSSRELFRMVAVKNGLASANSPAQIENAAARLRKEIRITPVLKSDLIQLKYSDTDPHRSAGVLQSLSDFYMDMHQQLHSSDASFDFFRRQASEYEQQLRASREKLRDFEDDHRIVQFSEQKDLIARKVVETEAALREARFQRAEAELRVTELREQINSREPLENAGMRSTEEAPDVNPVRQIVEGELARVEVNTTGLRARISALSGQLREFRGQLKQLAAAASEEQLLLHEVELAEQNYLLYSKKREEARIAQELERHDIANVAVVDPPRIPVFAKSKLASGVPAASLFGSMLVVAFCFAVGHRRTVMFTSWELEKNLGLPVLATIPPQCRPMPTAERVVPPAKLLPGNVEPADAVRIRKELT